MDPIKTKEGRPGHYVYGEWQGHPSYAFKLNNSPNKNPYVRDEWESGGGWPTPETPFRTNVRQGCGPLPPFAVLEVKAPWNSDAIAVATIYTEHLYEVPQLMLTEHQRDVMGLNSPVPTKWGWPKQ